MSKALKNTGFCLAIIVAAGLVYWNSLSLRAGAYDPLGSGTMPRIVAGLIVVLSVIALVQGFLGGRQVSPATLAMPEDEEPFDRRPFLAVTVFLYLIAAVALLAMRAPFGLTSALFLFISSLSIKRFDRKAILPSALCALGVGFGLTYLFGSLFGVDLP